MIADEAHRLTDKSGMYKNLGENQVKEIINTAKFSIFFLDESQRVTTSDIGSEDLIRKYAKELGANVEMYELESQFRCNGSDGYLAWIDNVLEIRETANYDIEGFNYDFEVFDDPNELRKAIIEKNNKNGKSRLLAGYCYEWKKESKNNPNMNDIVLPEYNFAMSWNLSSDNTFAISEGSINQVGCIHTSQGLEFDYAGVIIGKDLRYENGQIVTDFTKRAASDKSMSGIKGMYKKDPEKALKIADEIIKNTYRTLMTRGMKGCYVFCEDKALANYLKLRSNTLSKEEVDLLVAEEND